MHNFFHHVFKGSRMLWAVYIFFVLLSILAFNSASSRLGYQSSSFVTPMIRHSMFLLLGTICAIIAHRLPRKYVQILGFLGMILSLVFLVWTSFSGVSSADSSRFLRVFGIQFQPSELAKLSVIVFTAWEVSRIQKSKSKKEYVVLITLVFGVAVLIMMENMSTALLLLMVFYMEQILGGVPWKYYVTSGLVVFAILAMFLSVGFMVDESTLAKSPTAYRVFRRSYTWNGRITHFLTDDDVVDKYKIVDENYQINNAQIAISSAGVLGCGPGNSRSRNFLPMAYNDFIIAIIIEEYGDIALAFIMLFYLILAFNAIKDASQVESVFSSVMVLGLTMMIVMQAVVHIAVSAGVFPVTGQPLPLVSQGGTSAVLISIYFGLIIGVSYQVMLQKNKVEPDEFDSRGYLADWTLPKVSNDWEEEPEERNRRKASEETPEFRSEEDEADDETESEIDEEKNSSSFFSVPRVKSQGHHKDIGKGVNSSTTPFTTQNKEINKEKNKNKDDNEDKTTNTSFGPITKPRFF